MCMTFTHTYNDIISPENLLNAWEEFLRGKRNKKDVLEFGRHIMDNIFPLHFDLKSKTYAHGGYKAFNISDPKPRNIHKATVRDRLLHHAIYRSLHSYFDKIFIYDSYSCRNGKGTHKGINRLKNFAFEASDQQTKNIFILKCDIRKFFASIDQQILFKILRKYILDQETLRLLEKVILSFSSAEKGKGLPLGNLTSQLLVNIYMNEFDQWIKRVMKIEYYIRYADDFVIISRDKDYLLELTPKIADFLEENLKLSLHPDKVFLRSLTSGVDFLGWVHFQNHRILRTTTKRRMFKKLNDKNKGSYLGMLSHGNCHKIMKKMI